MRRKTYLNMIKAIYDKPTANILLNGEKLEALTLRTGTWQERVLSPLLLHVVLEVLATAVREEQEIRGVQLKRRKVTVCRDDPTFYTESPDGATKQLPELSDFAKVAGYKINAQKSLAFLYTNNKRS